MTQENIEAAAAAAKESTDTVVTAAEDDSKATTVDIVEDKADTTATDTAEETQEENIPDAPAYSDAQKSSGYDELYKEILEHFRSFTPAEQIASQITEEHITQYLEGSSAERIQQYKERREKRFLHFLEIVAVLTAIVLVVKFLSDNPALLTNILYILGGIIALYLWKHPHGGTSKTDADN